MRPIWREYYPRQNTTLLMAWAWAVAFDVFAKSCCDLYPKLLAINAVIYFLSGMVSGFFCSVQSTDAVCFDQINVIHPRSAFWHLILCDKGDKRQIVSPFFHVSPESNELINVMVCDVKSRTLEKQRKGNVRFRPLLFRVYYILALKRSSRRKYSREFT